MSVWTLAVPCISTQHMPTSESLSELKREGMLVAEYEQGGFVFIGEDEPPQVEGREWLRAIFNWAASNRFEWVRLDGCGDLVADLPTFAW